jgi:hypothetical protein
MLLQHSAKGASEEQVPLVLETTLKYSECAQSEGNTNGWCVSETERRERENQGESQTEKTKTCKSINCGTLPTRLYIYYTNKHNN